MKELRTLLFQRALYKYHAVMYLKKEIIIYFFIINIYASNLYMPMIWFYVFMLDFLIPFFCDPDLQCSRESTLHIGFSYKEFKTSISVIAQSCRFAKMIITLQIV